MEEQLVFEGRRHETALGCVERWAAEHAPDAPRKVVWTMQPSGKFTLRDGVRNYQVRMSSYGPVIYRIQ